MRITFALPDLSNLSGGLRVVAQYTRHLLDQGHSVSFAVRRPSYAPSWKRQVLNMIGLGRPTPLLGSERGHFTGIDVPVIHLDEAKRVRSQDILDADAIISTWWTTAEWADRLPPSKGRHIHFIQGYEDFYPKFSKRVRAVYQQNNSKIVVASWLKEKLLAEFGQPSRIVMNGVDIAHFTAPPRLRNRTQRIGFIYATFADKNSQMAIEVAKRVRRLRSDIDFVAFGISPRPDDLPDFISYERSPDQDRIPYIYGSCDLWLFVTRSEGFGLPILEAMACRTPVIATPAGAAPDLINGRNGFMSSLDPEEFTEAVLEFLSLPSGHWTDFSEAAHQTARCRSLTHAAQEFEAAVQFFCGKENRLAYTG